MLKTLEIAVSVLFPSCSCRPDIVLDVDRIKVHVSSEGVRAGLSEIICRPMLCWGICIQCEEAVWIQLQRMYLGLSGILGIEL